MTTRQTIKRFIQPAITNKRASIRSILRQIVISLQGPVNALFIGLIGSVLESDNKDLLVNYLLSYAGFLIFVHIFLEYAKTRGWAETFYPEMRTIQDKYLKEYIQIDGNYLDKIGTGKLMSIINKGFDFRPGLLDNAIGYTTSFIVSFIVGVYLSAQVGGLFAIIYIMAFVCIGVISIYFDRPSGKLRIKRRDVLNEYSRGLVRFIMSRADIIQYNKVNQEINRIGSHVDKASYYTLLQAIPQSRMFNVPRVIITIFRLIVYIVGANQYFQGKISLSTLTALLGFMLVIDGVMVQFIQGYKNFVKDRNVIELLWSTFDNAPKDKGLFEGKKFYIEHGKIELSNISYEYPGSDKVFDNFNYIIGGGQKTALVGPSGGGKSTLIKLIAGYMRPDNGSVSVDNQNLLDVSLQSYYPHIGYLTQEPSVFDGTIWENLTYGISQSEKSEKVGEIRNDEVSTTHSDSVRTTGDTNNLSDFSEHLSDLSGKIEKVIKLARCEFIYDFKDGLMTEIGEKGVRLSGGQRQRLAIAKIMLKDPAIILLDEPTSALDSENEELVTQALNELFKGKTVIVIAHRLQTVKHADQILYIDGGQIIESGTHQELIAKQGKYHKMVELQSGF